MNLIPMTRRMALRNAAAAIAAAAASPFVPRPGHAAGPVRKRKNIEKMGDELTAYKHAIKIVRDRGKANPNDPKGYEFWAALHDLFDESIHSGCAHFSEKFFPWHRRYLFDFEAVLQQSDPPVTANVTIPYWDWTVRPIQGMHFPSAFENPASVLFDSTRSNTTPPPWDADDVRFMVQEKDWNVFAGKPDPSNGFGRNPGSVESGPHNTLHSNISDDMADAQTAVQDPIFWSFHAGIDLVWSRWQRLHVSDSKPQPFADPNATLFFQNRSFTVGSTAKTTDYGYEYDYDFTADGPPAAGPALEAVSPSILAPPRSVAQLTRGALKGRDLTMTPPGKPPASTLLRLVDVKVLNDRSYRLNLYLHPKDVDLSSLSADARKAYFMRTITLWKAHHEGSVETFVRPTPPQAARLGEGWVVTVQSEDVVARPRPGSLESTAAVRPALPGTSDLVGSIELQER